MCSVLIENSNYFVVCSMYDMARNKELETKFVRQNSEFYVVEIDLKVIQKKKKKNSKDA